MNKISLYIGLLILIIALGWGIWYSMSRGSDGTDTSTINSISMSELDSQDNNDSDQKALGISKSEVEKHNTPEDCWAIINNEVYNITQYVAEHPGGSAAISRACGIDATGLFESQPQHIQQGAMAVLQGFKIGVLAQ